MKIIINYVYSKSGKAVAFLKSLKYSEYYNKYVGYYKDFKIYIEELSDLNYASFAYIPFLGWMIPFVFRKDRQFCIQHAKQGFVLFVMFVSLAVFLNLVNIFTPAEYRIFRFVIVLFIYFVYIAYIAFCVTAFNTARKGRDLKFYPVNVFADMIEI